MSIRSSTSCLVLVFLASVAFGDGITLPATERVVLDNGTVLILNENHDVPLIGLRAIIRGGAVADPADKHGLTDLLADLLQKGAGERSSSGFAEAIASVGGKLSVAVGLDYETAAPIRGVRSGGVGDEVLDVEVNVSAAQQ